MQHARVMLMSALLSVLVCGNTAASTIFFDDFNGSSLDESLWRLPVGPGTFFGRTQIKPPEFPVGNNLRPVVAGGSVILQLDTHNPSDPNANTFFGQEIQTRQTFSPDPMGISIETRMRFLGNPAPGIVGGFFTWGFDGIVRDEIDFELLTNDLAAEEVFTNVFNDDGFATAGDKASVFLSGYDMTQWNTYEIRWLPQRIQWLVNGVQIREEMQTLEDDPSEIRFNIWAADRFFVEAFNPALAPTDLANNLQYGLEIDYLRVNRVPEPSSVAMVALALGLVRLRLARRFLTKRE